MKTLLSLAITACIVAGLSSCSSSYNYYTAGLNKTNMSAYRSFAWLPPAGIDTTAGSVVTAVDITIKDATVEALADKGLRLEHKNPDLLVTYTAKIGDGSKTVYYPMYYGSGGYPGWGWGVGFGYGGWYGGYGGWYRPYYYGYGAPFVYYGGMVAADKERYKEGTVIIDLIDTHTKRVVWRGFGVSEVSKNNQKNINNLPKIVDGIIDQLRLEPPQSAVSDKKS